MARWAIGLSVTGISCCLLGRDVDWQGVASQKVVREVCFGELVFHCV